MNNPSAAELPGVGKTRLNALAAIGVTDVKSLLYRFPRGYQHRGAVSNVLTASADAPVSLILTVADEPKISRVRKNLTLLKFRAFDSSGTASVTFFNQEYLRATFRTGASFRFWGRIKRDYGTPQLTSPQFEPYSEDKPLPEFVSVYPLSPPLTQKLMSGWIAAAFRLAGDIDDPLDDETRESCRLCTLRFALENIHNPLSAEALDAARRRLAFDELYEFALTLRAGGSTGKRPPSNARITDTVIGDFLRALPYRLTASQRETIKAAAADMKSERAMRRIIIGDVGCGKTVCCAAAVYMAVKNGYRAALMAPTEILAAQHYNDLSPLFARLGVSCALLTGSTSAKARRELLGGLRDGDRQLKTDEMNGSTANTGEISRNTAEIEENDGVFEENFSVADKNFSVTDKNISVDEEISSVSGKISSISGGGVDFVVGTHALIEDDVVIDRLGLAVTDEQHRFGVVQREKFGRKTAGAHLLSMSATPIPRSLMLAMFGGGDVSRITDMPPGRQKVDTFAVGESYRGRLNAFIRRQAEAGRQTYIVCPSIEETPPPDSSPDKLSDEDSGDVTLTGRPSQLEMLEASSSAPLKSAVDYAAHLQNNVFPDLKVDIVHGRLSAREKDAAMRRFCEGVTDVLVSTTVIEVGVNVPNATLMIVENAERFGLSQLHQLRGRVGRGEGKGYCVLVSDSQSDTARERLKILCATNDGFEIAERDLAMRGPGDILSATAELKQHGELKFRLAGACTDTELMERAFAKAIADAENGIT